MNVQHLHAPLHESEERAVDRAIMQEVMQAACMGWQDLAECYKQQVARIQTRADIIERENIQLRRELDGMKEKISRYYKELA